MELIECIINLTDKKIKDKSKIKKKVFNCETKNLQNIIAELYKRLIVPLYIPVLMMISLLLIINSKEQINYSKQKFVIFLIGLFFIIFSESTLRFVNVSLFNNLIITLLPIIFSLCLYFYFQYKLKDYSN